MVEFSEPVSVTPAFDGKLTPKMVIMRSRAEDIGGISKVNLWGLNLSDVSLLRSMTNLRIVNMSTNRVTTLEPFSCCPLLQELYLRGNRIQDIHEVAHLKYLRYLQKLWLEGNPCCTAVFHVLPDRDAAHLLYRCTVIRNVINLTYLDYTAVTSEERACSENCGLVLTAPCPLSVDIENGIDDSTDQLLSSVELTDESVIDTDHTESEKTLSGDESNCLENDADKTLEEEFGEETKTSVPIPPTIEFLPMEKNGQHYNVKAAWLAETHQLPKDHEKTIKANELTSSSKRSHVTVCENERTVRGAVMVLLKILSAQSLEMVINAAERRLSRLERVTKRLDYETQPRPLPNGWDTTAEYDHTNYMDECC